MRLTKLPLLIDGFCTWCAMMVAPAIAIGVGDDVTFIHPIVESIGNNKVLFIDPWCFIANDFNILHPLSY